MTTGTLTKTARSLVAGDLVMYGSGPTEVLSIELMPGGITFDYADDSAMNYKPGGYLVQFKCRPPFKKNFNVYVAGSKEFTMVNQVPGKKQANWTYLVGPVFALNGYEVTYIGFMGGRYVFRRTICDHGPREFLLTSQELTDSKLELQVPTKWCLMDSEASTRVKPSFDKAMLNAGYATETRAIRIGGDDLVYAYRIMGLLEGFKL